MYRNLTQVIEKNLRTDSDNDSAISGGSLQSQRGAAMIVALIVVTVISLVAMSGMQDSNTQTNMVRNEQLHANAYQVAMSEINAQLDGVNLNDSDEIDNLIVTLISQEVGTFAAQPMLGPDGGSGAFNQTLTQASLCDIDSCTAPPGYSLGGGTRVLKAEINSVANLSNLTSRSDQTQGFWYLLPSAGGLVVSW